MLVKWSWDVPKVLSSRRTKRDMRRWAKKKFQKERDMRKYNARVHKQRAQDLVHFVDEMEVLQSE